MTLNVTTLTLLALLVSSFAISSLLQKRWLGLSPLAGAEFIFIGFILGSPLALGILDEPRLQAFSPMISLIIGLFGFFYGLEIAQVKFKEETSVLGLSQFCLILVAVGALVFYGTVFFMPELADTSRLIVGKEKFVLWGKRYEFHGSDTHLWLALTLGSLASVSSVAGVEAMLARWKGRGPFSSSLSRFTAPGEVLGILVFGAAWAAARSVESSQTLGWTVTEWTVAVIALGVFCGLLFWLFIGKDQEPTKIYLATIGVVTLASGVATSVGVSPLFLNFVCGAALALTSPHSDKIAEVLGNLKGPLSMMVLFFAGAKLTPLSGHEWWIPLLFLAWRYGAVAFFAKICCRSLADNRYLPGPGRAFYLQDILIVVIALDLSTRPSQIGPIVLVSALSAYVFFGIVGPFQFKRLLQDTGESTALAEAKKGTE